MKYFIFAFCLTISFSAIAKNPKPKKMRSPASAITKNVIVEQIFGSFAYRFTDTENGIVCYGLAQDAISCLKK